MQAQGIQFVTEGLDNKHMYHTQFSDMVFASFKLKEVHMSVSASNEGAVSRHIYKTSLHFYLFSIASHCLGHFDPVQSGRWLGSFHEV
jgi:hypothetical protein